ncbi:gamma-glutamylcyclotransferase family protein [Pollutibacter soli]|uniref:gamma-glutamylcyclotransferase family protein n=1 Tax=Pollutibacter soli TaxID=3034157 RepID=UPI003013722A
MSKKANPYYLFVYGTLRQGVSVPFKKKIEEEMEFVGKSQITGKLYDIGDYPGAVKEKEKQKTETDGRDNTRVVLGKQKTETGRSVIKGEVIKINNPRKVMALLDEYEGYNPKKAKTSEYLREKEQVKLEDGKEVEAWVYWYNLPVEGKRRIRHRDYLDYLKKKKPA